MKHQRKEPLPDFDTSQSRPSPARGGKNTFYSVASLRCTHKSSHDSKLRQNLTLPYRASLSLVRRGKDFSVAKSEGEVLSEMCVHSSFSSRGESNTNIFDSPFALFSCDRRCTNETLYERREGDAIAQVSAGVRSLFSGKMKGRITLFLLPYFLFAFIPNVATAQTQNSLKITVNSNQDEIKPDESLTLREAIALTNNTLSIDKLSDREKAQIQPANGNSRIEFNLPAEQTTIQLTEILPALKSPGTIIDGTTQPGYDTTQPANAKDFVPALPTRPVVAITSAPGKEVFRGLSIVADNVTIRGLSLYGFTSKHQITASLPPADIFIASSDIKNHTKPPKNVVIENNWLG
jgi:hypothetical protein